MRVLTLYRNGIKMGRAPAKNDHERGKRGEVVGWSPSAAKRNVDFLRSIASEKLSGFGYTATFTLKNCPDTSTDWHRLRRALFMRFERMGMLRCHWVTEWQRRGVPHLHGIFYFPEPVNPATLVAHWLAVAQEFVVSPKAQHVREVTHIVGWFKYVCKHASRGHQHYQRTKGGIPKGWEKTGRVWGHTGEWEIMEPQKFMVDDDTFFRLRRIARRMAIANARVPEKVIAGGVVVGEKVNGRNVSRMRRMLKHNNAELSRLRGFSEWLPIEYSIRLLELQVAQNEVKILPRGEMIEYRKTEESEDEAT